MPKLIVTKGSMKGKVFSFGGEVIFVGRATDNDIQLEGIEISRKQLKIYRNGKKIFIEDLISRNGTAINSEVIVPGKGYEVTEKDTISIANTAFRLSGLPSAKAQAVKDAAPGSVSPDSKKKKLPAGERRASSRKNLELIWGVTELFRTSLGINEILEKVLDYIVGCLPRIDTAVIVLVDEQNKKPEQIISMSRQGKGNAQYSRGIVDRVIEERKSVRMSNTKYEPPEILPENIIELKIRSIMCVPMISNEKMLGVIYMDSRGAYGFRKDDLLLINSLSGPVAVGIEKAILASRLEKS